MPPVGTTVRTLYAYQPIVSRTVAPQALPCAHCKLRLCTHFTTQQSVSMQDVRLLPHTLRNGEELVLGRCLYP